MKLLMISTDRSAFEKNSPFSVRLEKYGNLFGALHVVVFTDAEYMPNSIGTKVSLWPTQSRFKILAPFHAYTIASRVVRGHEKDFVVSSQEEFGALTGALLKWRRKIPWQAQIHSDPFSPHFASFSFKNRIRVFLLKLFLPHASAVRVVGERVKESLEAHRITKKPIVVLPIYTPVRNFGGRDYQNPFFDFAFLMASRLTPEKNVELAIRTMSGVIEQYPQTTLRIAGDGPERIRLEKLAKELNLGAHVQFLGWQRELESQYEISHAFLLTSWYEGYSLSVIEAMAFGLPIVMMDVGVAGDMVRNNESGVIVKSGDESALYEALLKVRKDAQFREKIGRAAQKIVSSLPSEDEYLKAFQESILACAR